MNVKTVTYARIKNLGNYENERAEVVVELNKGDDYLEAFKTAEQIVCNQLNVESITNRLETKYHAVLAEKDKYTYKEVSEAENYFAKRKNIVSGV